MSQQLPTALLASLQTVKGFDETSFVQVHQSGEQITSIRVNPSKKSGIVNLKSKIPWSSQGFYLSERPSFTSDPLFHAGTYYVQEASSMFLEEALKQTIGLAAPIRVLDLCAAPGGKSTLLQSLISGESLLVSNEVIKTRVTILTENITKWGAANVVVTNNDAKDFQRLQNYFDVIVVDAPCSGSGLFRKDSSAIEEWSENNVELCSQRQQRILADVMSALKEDGVLIYSTCSYSKEEDENIGDWLIDEFGLKSIALNLDEAWGIVETISEKNKTAGYRFYPDKVKGEGLFIAAFKNSGEPATEKIKINPKHKPGKLSAKETAVAEPWLANARDFYFIKLNEEVIALPLFLEQQLPILQSALYIKKAGIKLGSVIRNELIPHHELALSNIIAAAAPAVEVDKATALQYLRKEEIKIETELKGWALVKFQQQALGWIKILPNRINNYYPAAWRILNK